MTGVLRAGLVRFGGRGVGRLVAIVVRGQEAGAAVGFQADPGGFPVCFGHSWTAFFVGRVFPAHFGRIEPPWWQFIHAITDQVLIAFWHTSVSFLRVSLPTR